jgi:hybrid cluster-associated redox disulfide protein
MVQKQITGNMKIAEIVEHFPETIEVFMEYGIACFGCGMANLETLEEGVSLHGIDPEEILEDLNFIVAN